MNLEQFNFNAHILVFGDIMLDRYWHGDTDRISPESPVPVVNIANIDERPGGAANVALNLASLGVKVTLMGLVGKDEAAQQLKDVLAQAGVALELIAVDAPTITKLRVVSRSQQLIRLDFEQKLHQHAQQNLLDSFVSTVAECDLVILSDYGKGTLAQSKRYINIAREHNIPVFVDPKANNLTPYKGATLVTPNKKEFETLVGEVCETHAQICKHANVLIDAFDIKSLLITLGAKGMLYVSTLYPDGLFMPTSAKEVFDVTGAGDTVISMMALAHTEAIDIQAALHLATCAAAIVIGRMGTSVVSRHELNAQLMLNAVLQQGIYTQVQLKSIVSHLKQQSKKIVMTNGCFDILHLGHVEYLRAAKALGDVLIVAVNTDDSVKKLKGSARPINPCQMRMGLLAELNCVDLVVPFAQDTPEQLIADILPDILVKGGDYTVETIAGSKQVLANGGKVEIIPLLEGYSTSAIVEKAQFEQYQEKA